ncbi:hypothetical protein [Parapedobacter sp.]
MEKIVLLSLGLFALTACNNPESGSSENTEAQTPTESTAIGGEKDDHGCLVGAGETWSELQQGCVQIFDIGQRLNPVEVPDGGAVISAFVLWDDDRSKAELFLPDGEGAIIMEKGENEIYQKDSVKFDASAAALYINGKMTYKAD